MLWKVFGAQLDKVPIEEVFKLSEREVEAFGVLKHLSIEGSLAKATKQSLMSF